MDYATALSNALEKAPVASGLTRTEIEQHIAAITQQLKGSLGNAERIMLCADRQSLRKALTAIDQSA